MKILYWVCFVYIIIQSLNWLYRILKNGFNDSVTAGAKAGTFLGTLIGLVTWFGVIWFYLH